MKKLRKLNIKSEKIINNEELVSLRGGYGGDGSYGGHGTKCPDGKDEYYCGCFGIVGAWYGCFYSLSGAQDTVTVYCEEYGGSCSKV